MSEAATNMQSELEKRTELMHEFKRQALAAEREAGELRERNEKLTEALREIAEQNYPDGYEYEWAGDHETDARDTFPNRIRWLTDRARAALSTGEDQT